MTTPNQCQFWDCNETLRRRDHFLCSTHYAGYEARTIDQCPACGQYKDAEHDVCRKCYQQTASAWRQRPSAAGQRAGYADDGLLEELRSLRRGLAQAGDIQDYMVFNDNTLRLMTERRPTTPEAMLEINGVGPVKMERYGSEFLKVIRENTGRNTKRQDSQPPRQRNAVQRDNREFSADKDADPRNRYPAEYRTSDGHYVRSRAEAMIDNWLFNHHIAHAYERKLPVEEDALCDFYLPQGNVYVEFWGKENDPSYARRMREKQEIYRRNNLKLISLTDDELYRLDDHMPGLLRSYGVTVN